MAGDDDEYAKMMELQRQAFEAQFGSLESMGFEDKTRDLEGAEDEDNTSSSDNTAGGIEEDVSEFEGDEKDAGASKSEPEEEKVAHVVAKKVNKPRVIKFQGPSDIYMEPSKKEQKLIRSGKTLSQINKKLMNEPSEEENSEDDDLDGSIERENMENDLELQQFLRESHLLSTFNAGTGYNKAESGVGLTLKSINNTDVAFQDDMVMGKARSRTLEMRLGRLSRVNGDERKMSKLEKVPMQMRKGMVSKHVQRIERYEQDALDGGIVLSKVKKGQFRKIESTYKKDIERRIGSSIKRKDEMRNTKRKRGLKIQSVGRSTRNGLIISKNEIARINGTNKGKPSGKKGHRRK